MPKREHFEQCLSAFLAIGLAFLSTATALAENTAQVATYQQANGPHYFAMSVSLPEPVEAGTPEVVMLVDTSASQAGLYREDAIAAAKSALAALPADARVQFLACDLQTVPLTNGFVAPQGEAMEAAFAKLNQRAPLGATDMEAVVRQSVEKVSKGGKLNRSIIYIGDGSSRANFLTPAEFESIVNTLRDAKVAFNSLAIGPHRDIQTLATLANHTGGMVLVDSSSTSAEEFGVQLASAASTAVVWPASAKFSSNVAETYPKHFPPLRADRDTIIVGVLSDDQPVKVDLKGSGSFAHSWEAKPDASSDDHAYLPQLMEMARVNNGLGLPTVGSAGLRETARTLLASAEDYARLSSQALAAGDPEGAIRLAKAAMEIDPDHPRAKAVVSAATKQAEEAKQETPEEKPPVDRGAAARQIPVQFVAFQNEDEADPAAPLNLGPGEGRFLEQAELNRIRQSRIIEADVEQRLVAARAEMGVNPAGTRDALKLLLDNLERTPELDADVRTRLRNQIVAAIREAGARAVIVEQRRAELAEREAIARERLALTEALLRDEERARVITEMFTALMAEGKHAEAAEAAVEVRQIDPYNQAAVAGVEISEVVGNYRDITAIKELRYRRVIDTLWETEKSHVPFPDEPPIVYPDAEFWEEIYYRKEKYGSVDLASTGTAEQRIFQQLEAETKIQFIDTPLEEVVGYLKQLHGIEIQIDNRALEDVGLSTDTPVTRNIEGISLRSALRLMLKELDLTYIVANEVLMITTPEEAESELITKVYPVADLVLPVSVQMGTLGGGMGGQNMNTGGSNFGGGGVGGGGGGFGGGGGGVFAVPDEKSVSKLEDAAPVPRADEADATEAEEPAKAFILEVKEGETRLQAWERTFEAGVQVPQAAVRSEVRRAMSAKRYADIVGVIQLALRHGQLQPWMYEAMGLALQLDHAPQDEIERALMSAIDFTSGPNHMLVVAALMSRLNLDERALKLYQDVSQIEPLRPEPYAMGLTVAKRLNDQAGIRWACVGILSQEWPKDHLEVRSEAFRTAQAVLKQMVDNKELAEAKKFDAAIREALVRDAIVKVTWSGEADLDLMVEEPSGSVCSQHNPRTISGGIFLGDAASSLANPATDGAYEVYVVPKGFKGDYKMLVRKVWGEVTAGKITVDVFTNYGTDDQFHERHQVDMGKDGAFITFNVPNGRRTESLAEHQVKVAADTHLAMSREIVAQRLNSASYESTATEEYVSDVDNNSNDFVRRVRDSVGYRPVITTLPEGTNFSAFAVISADRRYVRFNGTPFFSAIGEVTTFSFFGPPPDNDGGGGGLGGGGGGLGGGGGGF